MVDYGGEKIEKEKEQVEKELWHFFNQDLCSAEDGLKALRKVKKGGKYHKLKEIEVVERLKRKGGVRGRPKNGEDLQCFYHIKAGLEEDEGATKREILSKGKIIVATNELDCEKLSDEEALKAYKEQQHAERGFRFLKDPFFFADSMFLKKRRQDSRDGAMASFWG